ncbi:MAG: TRAM domain-containing protein [Nitrospirae bacterium]|nr:MAG: TRAM domain-containing protein [Nitrospirota bacterium]
MVLRTTFVVLCIVAGLALFSEGFEQGWIWGTLVGLVVAGAVLTIEYSLTNAKPGTLLGGLSGLAVGLLLAGIAAWAVAVTLPSVESVPILGFLLLAACPYLGVIYGVKLFSEVGVLKRSRGTESGAGGASISNKILDTSVIIDGRVADLCETGFLEGTFILPQFILQELQHIADSSDPLKRSRGRRGLDILNKIQKMVDIDVRIVEEDFPHVKEVDSKIVVLGKKMNARIITNDLNLSKVAELQGVRVLNINELCNALKPVVLPGEQLRVFVLKEGKEAGQGVAYLDDGTMIVVDNAKRFIGSNVNVVVTSVLQTQAGRMIFTRLKEESEGQDPGVARS